MEVTITLRDELMPIIESAAQRNGLTVHDYIVEIIERAVRKSYDEKLERLLLEGLNSGPAIEVTPVYWQELRAELAAIRSRRSHS